MKNIKTFNKLKLIIFSFLIFIANMNVSYAERSYAEKKCEGVLSGEFTEFLKDAFGLMKIAGPILVIIMTTIDLIKAVASGGKDDLPKLGTKTVKRLIYAVLLFVIPSLLDWTFKLFGIYDLSTCGIGS